jgi:uroporphyrinogen decarboxylase
MNKRDLVFSLLDSSSKPAGVPAAFFLHFDPAYHTGRAAVEKHLEYFRYTDMDFVKIQFELDFPAVEVHAPADWAKMPFLPLEHYQPMLDVVRGLVEETKKEAPVVLTLYSPYMLTNTMAGEVAVTRTMQEDPEAYRRAIGIMTDSLMQFVKEAIRLGLDGFYTSTQGGEKDRLPDPALFDDCIRPYDLAIMEEVNRACPLNILHICDYHLPYDDIRKYADYPGQIVNASLDLMGNELPAKEAAALFGRPFMGGLVRKGAIAHGPVEAVRAAARRALAVAPERFLLGADCTVPADTPWENLRAAIAEAHQAQKAL